METCHMRCCDVTVGSMPESLSLGWASSASCSGGRGVSVMSRTLRNSVVLMAAALLCVRQMSVGRLKGVAAR